MSDDVFFEHVARGYPIGNLAVNDGIPLLAASLISMEETRGERIKRLREARYLTQPALARLLISMGASPTLTKAAIHKWESGDTTNMKNDTFILLCQALATDAAYLLWGPNRTPPEGGPVAAERKRKA